MTPAANGKKQKEKEKTETRRDWAGEPATRDPGHGQPGRRKPDTKTVSLFVFVSAGYGDGALCSVLGSAPEGSALNPPPFQYQLELDPRTGGERRSSPEPQMELDHNAGLSRGFEQG